jgi:hypothetical protein
MLFKGLGSSSVAAFGILLIGAGRFVIKASYFGGGDFRASSATATVTIAKASRLTAAGG